MGNSEFGNINLIFLKDKFLFSIKSYSSWREIQDEFYDYKASLDFKSIDHAREYILFDYDISKEKLDELLEPIVLNKQEVVELDF